MTYAVGIDLGTTFTAAAVCRDGRSEVVSLGNRSPAIPSVVYLRADDTILCGEAAERRALTEPGRVAREFKRRLGDPTPILLGGSPYSAEALQAELLRSTVSAVADLEGGAASRVAVTHPANWGPYKKDLLGQAISLAGLDGALALSEPEAAAIYYASTERVEVGAVFAVYDLGGGTFDATVLRKTAEGFEVAGTPEGVERLGGIDFDEAVFQHVRSALGGLEDLDSNDQAVVAAVVRLRDDCRAAKEALSSDNEAVIPVMLPDRQTEVRLTRGEFEDMIRPVLRQTTDALARALASASVESGQVDKVLLVGGSSRIPLVAELVSGAFGRPVAVDAHPKYAVALGAALAVAPSVAATPVTGAPAPPPPVEPPTSSLTPPTTTPEPPPGARPVPPAGTEPAPAERTAAAEPPPVNVAATADGRRLALYGVGALLVIAILAVVLMSRGGDDDAPVAAGATATVAPTVEATMAPTADPGLEFAAAITDISVDGSRYVVDFQVAGFQPQLGGVNKHLHFFFDTVPPSQAGNPGSGPWKLHPAVAGTVGVTPFTNYGPGDRPSGANQLCVLVANADHSVIQGTGNCLALP